MGIGQKRNQGSTAIVNRTRFQVGQKNFSKIRLSEKQSVSGSTCGQKTEDRKLNAECGMRPATSSVESNAEKGTGVIGKYWVFQIKNYQEKVARLKHRQKA